ncbi:unnamed protein product [Arctogadus glacialis]
MDLDSIYNKYKQNSHVHHGHNRTPRSPALSAPRLLPLNPSIPLGGCVVRPPLYGPEAVICGVTPTSSPPTTCSGPTPGRDRSAAEVTRGHRNFGFLFDAEVSSDLKCQPAAAAAGVPEDQRGAH